MDLSSCCQAASFQQDDVGWVVLLLLNEKQALAAFLRLDFLAIAVLPLIHKESGTEAGGTPVHPGKSKCQVSGAACTSLFQFRVAIDKGVVNKVVQLWGGPEFLKKVIVLVPLFEHFKPDVFVLFNPTRDKISCRILVNLDDFHPA